MTQWSDGGPAFPLSAGWGLECGQPVLSSVGAHGAPLAASAAVFSFWKGQEVSQKNKKGLHKSLYTRRGERTWRECNTRGLAGHCGGANTDIKRAAGRE